MASVQLSGPTSYSNSSIEASWTKKSFYKMQAVPEIKTLDELTRELHRIFEDDNVNIDYVRAVMSSYKSNPREWKPYAKFDRHRYTRNLVDEGNGKFNLMVLAWSEGQGSSIHDHANSHCFMKILDGTLREVRFSWPSTSKDERRRSISEEEGMAEDEAREMIPTGETLLTTNEVAYINDSLGLHRMENVSHSDTAVSLHLYCPPFESVQLFDQRTGHTSTGKVTFWTKYGKRTPFVVDADKLLPSEYENN